MDAETNKVVTALAENMLRLAKIAEAQQQVITKLNQRVAALEGLDVQVDKPTTPSLLN